MARSRRYANLDDPHKNLVLEKVEVRSAQWETHRGEGGLRQNLRENKKGKSKRQRAEAEMCPSRHISSIRVVPVAALGAVHPLQALAPVQPFPSLKA